MSEAVDGRAEEATDGLVQLRFADEAGQIQDLNAAELAEVLQGLVEFTGQMARAGLFGDGPPPEVRVRPPQEGSFIVEALITWAVANPEAALGMAMTAGGALTKALEFAIRKMRGVQVADFDYLDNGMGQGAVGRQHRRRGRAWGLEPAEDREATHQGLAAQDSRTSR